MNWILAGFLVFASSVAMYLLVRMSNALKVPLIYQNLSMFIVPLPLYLVFARMTDTSLHVTPHALSIIVLISIFCSYLGNIFSLKSIEYAPNPGYSLIIQKSYVVFTTLVAVLFLGGVVTIRSGLAILLIILASAMVMIGKPKSDQSHVRLRWLPYALGAFLCFGMLAIMSKYLLDLGVPVYTRLIYLAAIVSGIICIEMILGKKQRFPLSGKTAGILLLIGLLSASFNYFIQVGYSVAPNIGYINAFNASSIAGISLFSAVLFRDELNTRKFIGIIGVILGLMLLVL
ncbi:EamA family transporter [Candidatus Woesebacteria bacterium]|nr:EamA family transporter [Candidatus Woesebacteria bacterium]